MRSRLLIGASGWLLGAAAATCGSMLAVNHLAHGLLGPGTQQVSSADDRNDLVSSQRAVATPKASATTSAAEPAARPAARPIARPAQTASGGSAAATGGTLLISRGGSVMASCQAGLAYLQYWSPAQGYQADNVVRGPAAKARVAFESVTSELVMTVTCQGGKPADQVFTDH
jgi:hypothetical protein